MSIALIGAIEGNYNRTVEKEYILLCRSLRRNGGKYKDMPIHLLQPTESDIHIRTRIELAKLGVKFEKNPIFREDTGRGFLNMPVTCAYLSERNPHEETLWLDCDSIILGEPELQTIEDTKDFAVHTMMGYGGCSFFNEEHERAYHEDMGAQMILKDIIYGSHGKVLHHINTWFMHGKSLSPIWNTWNNITHASVQFAIDERDAILSSDIVTLSGQGDDKTSMEYAISSVEEMAMGFILQTPFYNILPQDGKGTEHQKIDVNTKICHYDDFGILKQLTDDPWIHEQIREIEEIIPCQ